MTYGVTRTPAGTPVFSKKDSYRPEVTDPTQGDGLYETYCSHWFEPRPDWKDGGQLAVGWYEHGTRFLSVAKDGTITENGFFSPVATSSSAAYWASDDVVYVMDYQRGLDVLRFHDDGTAPRAKARGAKGLAPDVRPGEAEQGRAGDAAGQGLPLLTLGSPPCSRHDGRAPDDLRTVTLTRGWLDHAEGSCLVEFGRTRVLVAASATEGVPRWRKGSGLGWVTAEYAMLPRATHTRSDRESVKGKVGGRTHEISRLVGRSLRAAIDLKRLGENTIAIDCDVLQADGGTRTAAITGAYVALADACARLGAPGAMVRKVAAISVGVVDGVPVLDLDYPEDVSAGTDMNVVATADGELIEVQGTAEGAPFSRTELDALLDLALGGIGRLTSLQAEALASPLRGRRPDTRAL